MTKIVSLETVRDHLEALITDIQTHGASVIIQQGNHPVAVLLSENEYTTLQHLKQQVALRDLGVLLDQIHAQNAHISEEEAAQDVLKAYHEGR
ncbi:MAG: type II toxin-antitoxin system Phd/YefM family antitoxin [Candidatus Latescibacteria bacterium]|nr:type II toxin-antitoxin system Phd/YefM family antitoxin [Candidatus Latescibacterota bacterium]